MRSNVFSTPAFGPSSTCAKQPALNIKAPVTPTPGLLRRAATKIAWIVVAIVSGDPATLLRL
jgi:hypothetical protein